MNGRIKRKVKNCLRVALSTEKPAQMLSMRRADIWNCWEEVNNNCCPSEQFCSQGKI